ncbi:MAG: hypothetical protein KatS3mg087_0106 [Patescibacteria group bacterium]|nr:MAG: hypothetical protein KatS3mg087_0106 [Patescibacteria group bacterium]
MNLPKYEPKDADIVLWDPILFREVFICKALKQPYHHVSLIKLIDGQPYIVEQNVDFVPENPTSLESVLKLGHQLKILRAFWLSKRMRLKVIRAFDDLIKDKYSYKDALTIFLAVRGLLRFPKAEEEYFISYLKPGVIIGRKYKNGKYKIKMLSRVTCATAVNLAFIKATKVNLCPDIPLEYTTPMDLYNSKYLKVEGTISSDTEIITPKKLEGTTDDIR